MTTINTPASTVTTSAATNTGATNTGEAAPGKARRRRLRAVAAVGAVVATSAIWLVASALGADFRLTDAAGSVVLSLPTIIAFTLWFVSLGWLSLALLERFSRRRRPIAARTAWTVLAASVTALSLVPIYLENATAGTKVSLTVIHLAVAAVLIPALRRSARR
jgi:hypothetical protein